MLLKSACLSIKLVILLTTLVILPIQDLGLFFDKTIFSLWKPSTPCNWGGFCLGCVEIFKHFQI